MPSLALNSFASMGAPSTAPSSPAISRSNSVASNLSASSHKSEPAWLSSSNGASPSRRSTQASIKTTSTSTSTKSGGLKHFFSAEGRAERKERKRQEDERLASVVLTSKAAAVARTRVLLEQHNKIRSNVKTAGVQGTGNSAHLTAAAQEARLPHSGPPALHASVKDHNRDLPALTRIVSGDERDEEDERQARLRNEWSQKKANVTMAKLAEGEDSSGDDQDSHTSHVVEVDGHRLVGVQLDTTAYSPKAAKSRRGFGGGWSKSETGVWTR
jgi:hypothetical protein